MCPEYAHIQKTKQIAHHDVYGRFCEQNAGTFRHQTFRPWSRQRRFLTDCGSGRF
jgi:hypothetical protein